VLKIPDPIQWHEGMLLMPQHFQQMAGRFEGLVQNAVATVGSPYPWGLLRLEYDRSTLVDGWLRVLHVQAVMRDGFFVEGGAELGIDLQLNLTDYVEQMRDRPLTVYLAVPAQNSLSTRGELARYFSHSGEAITDDATGEDPVVIPWLRPRLTLWAGDFPPARFVSVPILRIQTKNNVFLADDYIAPARSVTVGSPLGKLCGETTGFVRERSRMLADQLRSGSFAVDNSEAAELRIKVQALAVGLPSLEAALVSGAAHPFAVYLLFCQLAGHVATVTSDFVAPQFLPYRHDDLLATFQPVLHFIRKTVSDAVVESWSSTQFRLVNGIFEAPSSAMLDETIAQHAGSDAPLAAVALRVPPGVPEQSVWHWGDSCVIGSAGAVAPLLATRVSGAERRRVERLPGLAPPRGMVLFALGFDENAVKPGEALQLIERFLSEGRPSEAVLYLKRPQAATEDM
jgi:type VI secretion system protein ImpJ